MIRVMSLPRGCEEGEYRVTTVTASFLINGGPTLWRVRIRGTVMRYREKRAYAF